MFARLAAVLILAALGGCSSYVNSPTASAARVGKREAFSHPLIERAANAKPAIRFPATIAISPKDGAAAEQLRALDANGKLDVLKSLPQIGGVLTLSSLLFADGNDQSMWNKSDVMLREAAARMHADAVLILKIETTSSDGTVFSPLSLATLGLFPNNHTHVMATALAALVDTRTGYVYGIAERSAAQSCLAMSWDEFTGARTIRRAQREAMEKLTGDFPAFWRGIVQTHRR